MGINNFKKYGYPKQLPEIISYLVTNKCVCRCRHCFNWFETGYGGAIGNINKKDLSLDEIEQVFKKLGRIDYIYIGGGEPFIRKDISEIIKVIYKNCQPQVINISTNGQLIDNTIKSLETALTPSPNLKLIIKVSIDAIGKDHDEIRQRKDAFQNAITTYKYLHSLKKKFSHLEIGINTVFSNYNQNKIMKIYNYLATMSPPPDCMAQLLVRAEPKEKQSKEDLHIKEYKCWTERYVQDMLAGQFEKDLLVKIATILLYEYVYKTITEHKQQIHCYAGISGAVIDNEGNVSPCEHKQPYGNLRQNNYDFRKIWHSESAEKMRKETYVSCFCTNEPQWWHPSIRYNKNLVSKGKIIALKSLFNNKVSSYNKKQFLKIFLTAIKYKLKI